MIVSDTLAIVPSRPRPSIIGHEHNRQVVLSLLGDVGVAPGLHLDIDRQGLGTVVRTSGRANGRRDVGPGCSPRLERLLSSRYDEPEPSRRQVICTLLALDPDGRLVYSGFIPGSPPGHRRPSGFEAPPGRHGHGVFQLPIDLAHDSYTAPCRPAAWHGGTAI